MEFTFSLCGRQVTVSSVTIFPLIWVSLYIILFFFINVHMSQLINDWGGSICTAVMQFVYESVL